MYRTINTYPPPGLQAHDLTRASQKRNRSPVKGVPSRSAFETLAGMSETCDARLFGLPFDRVRRRTWRAGFRPVGRNVRAAVLIESGLGSESGNAFHGVLLALLVARLVRR